MIVQQESTKIIQRISKYKSAIRQGWGAIYDLVMNPIIDTDITDFKKSSMFVK